MASAEIDAYLASVDDDTKRHTLTELRRTIRTILPDAEEGISYKCPAFRVHGKVVAGFAAFKNHLAYLPFSGSVIPVLSQELRGYGGTKSSLHFPVDQPLPETTVRKLIDARLDEIRKDPRQA